MEERLWDFVDEPPQKKHKPNNHAPSFRFTCDDWGFSQGPTTPSLFRLTNFAHTSPEESKSVKQETTEHVEQEDRKREIIFKFYHIISQMPTELERDIRLMLGLPDEWSPYSSPTRLYHSITTCLNRIKMFLEETEISRFRSAVKAKGPLQRCHFGIFTILWNRNERHYCCEEYLSRVTHWKPPR